MLLHRQVGAAVVEQRVLEHQVGRGERGLDVAELERDPLVDVAVGAVVVDPRLGRRQRLLEAGDGGQRLVVDLHRQGRLVGRVLGDRRHRHDRVADEAHPVGAERVLVLGDRQDAEGLGHRLAGEEAEHPGDLPGAAQIDAADAGVRHGRAHQLHVRHAREDQVVGEQRPAGHLGAAVDAPERLPDVARPALGGRRGGPLGDRLGHQGSCSAAASESASGVCGPRR